MLKLPKEAHLFNLPHKEAHLFPLKIKKAFMLKKSFFISKLRRPKTCGYAGSTPPFVLKLILSLKNMVIFYNNNFCVNHQIKKCLKSWSTKPRLLTKYLEIANQAIKILLKGKIMKYAKCSEMKKGGKASKAISSHSVYESTIALEANL